MNPADSLLLDLPEPGEFLRFVHTRSEGGGHRFSLEGGGGDDLAARAAIALTGLRPHGYAFAPGTALFPERSCDRGAEVVIHELRPRSHESRIQAGGKLGFGGGAVPFTSGSLRLPHWSLPTPGAGSIARLFVACSGLERVEIDFTRVDLDEAEAALLQGALDLHLAAGGNAVPDFLLGGRPTATPSQAFLARWLLEGRGWEVALRLVMKAGATVPPSVLQAAGRTFFQCDCERVGADADPQEASAPVGAARSTVDFSRRFPRGWSFPALLPSGGDLDDLNASRLHSHPLPRLPREGLVIGAVEGRRVRLPGSARDRHTYIVGATGTGKSTLLERMIRGDLQRGEGVVLLDPHGDLYHRIRAAVPPSREHEVFCLDPIDASSAVPAYNVLDLPRVDLAARRQGAARLADGLLSLFEELWDMRSAGGPMFDFYFRNTLLLMTLQNEKGGHRPHLGQFSQVLTDEDYRKRLLLDCECQDVVDFWTKTAERVKGDARLENIAPYITSKLSSLTQGGYVAKVICQESNTLRLRERLDAGGILLVNLDKGCLGARESSLLGTLLMHELFAAGLARSSRSHGPRRPVNIYVDEFQNFVSDTVASMLSEARKFGLRLILANQTLAQLRANPGRQDLLETVLGNVGTLLAFRLGVPDADRLRMFLEPFTPADLKELPNFHAFARLLTGEGPLRPFVFRTLGPAREPRQVPTHRPGKDSSARKAQRRASRESGIPIGTSQRSPSAR